MDSIREVTASSVFELAATGIPNGGSHSVWITSIADLGNGQTAFAGYTRGYLNSQDFKYTTTDCPKNIGKKFIGILEEKIRSNGLIILTNCMGLSTPLVIRLHL